MTEMFWELERRHVGYGYLGVVGIRSWEDRGGILGLGSGSTRRYNAKPYTWSCAFDRLRL